MKINVTEKDINKGKIDSPISCPIALATKRVVKKDFKVDVDEFYLELYNNDLSYRTRLPGKAIRFIKSFDKGKKVKPISFEIKNISTSKVKVSVTENDFEYNCAYHAVEDAIIRAFKKKGKVFIGNNHKLVMHHNGVRFLISLPYEVKRKIPYNSVKKIKPFTFELNIPKLR